MPPETERRTLIADAGLQVLADGGPRALTHRAVDAAAGLPGGSTSYYFRTRRALLEAIMRRLADLERAEAGTLQPAPADTTVPAPAPGWIDAESVDEVAARFARLLDTWLIERRATFLARHACFLEAAADPELRAVLETGRAFRDDASALLARLGAPDPVQGGRHLVAFLDGLLFDRLAGAGALTAPAPGSDGSRADLAAAIAAALRGLTTGPASAR